MPEIRQKLGFDAAGAVKSLTDLSGAMDKASTSMKKLQGSTQKFNNNAKGVVDSQKKIAKGAKDITLSWQTMARVLQTQVIVRGINLMIQSFKQATKEAVEFRLAVAEIQSIAHQTIGTNDQLAASVLNLSAQLGKDAADVAEGLYQVLSNQVVESAEAITFLENAEKLAIVTHSDTKDAVNALSSVMNSYGKTIDEVEHVSGTLFKTIELGRLRLADIADILGRVTPLAAEMGVSWEEAAAAIATMTRQGVKADTAVTQLRAVMQKIIKPTDAMIELFNKWGVRDGPAAIRAFGGLTGVLKKMSEETDGSTAEMAELFRRVRAIVGFLGIMTDEGNEVAETLKQIEGATIAATDAFEEYASTDAHQLVVAWNEVKVKGIELASALLPAFATMTKNFAVFVESQADGWRVILNWWDRGRINLQRIAKINAETTKAIELSRKNLAKQEVKGYKEAQAAAAQYYASLNRDENILRTNREGSIKAANAGYKRAGDELVNFYKKNTKSLADFINNSADLAKDTAREVADIQGDIDDRRLDNRLSKAGSVLNKLNVLEAEAAAKTAKVAASFGQIDASEESKERAMHDIDAAIAMAERGKSLAEQTGHLATIDKWESRIIGLLTNKKAIAELYNEEVQKAVPDAKELYNQQIKDEGRLQELAKERAKVLGDAAEDGDEAAIKSAKIRAEAIDKEIDAIFDRAELGSEFLKSLGITENMKLVSDGLQEAFDRAHVDWEAEIDRGQAIFDKAQLTVRAKLDPTGERAATEEALGVPARPEGRVGDEASRADQAAEQILKENSALTNKLREINIKRIGEQRILNQTFRDEALIRGLSAKEQANSLTLDQKAASLLDRVTAGKEASLVAEKHFIKDNNAEVFKQEAAIGKVNSKAREFIRTLQEGGTVTDATLFKEAKRIESLRQQGKLESDSARVAQERLLTLKNFSELNKQTNDLEAQRPEAGKVEAAQKLIDSRQQYLDKVNEAKAAEQESANKLQEAKSAAGELSTNAGTAAQKASSLATASKNVATNTRDAATNSSDMATSTSDATTAAGNTTTAVNILAQAYAKAALQAERMARASAAAGSATAFHGGPTNYFAAGGVARGQDQIPAVLARGETVVSSKNSQRFFSELNAMNQGSQPVYREQGGPVTNVGDVNVTVKGGDSSQQTVREIGQALRREVQRGTIKLS